MAHRYIAWIIALVFIVQSYCGNAQGQNSAGDGVIRWLSSDLKRIETRLAEIEYETKSLPDSLEKPWGSRYGHRSGDLPDENTEDWLQLDLGRERIVDSVVLMPANLEYLGKNGAGYGFPKRFKVEISNDPEMRDAIVLVDHSASDVFNPGRYPLVFKVKPTAGKYIRFTSLKHYVEEGKYFWAIEELMVLEGNINVAASRTGELKHSSYMGLFPQWVPVRSIDSQSGIGMPVDVNSPSPTQGYMSAKLSMKSFTDPLKASEWKWCTIDLGEPQVIEEMRVLPLESDEYEVVGGRGFPRRMIVQLSNDPNFEDVLWESFRGEFALGYPSGCGVNMLIPEIKARYARLQVHGMWSRDDFFIFGLSEIQVYGSNQNLSLGKPVTVKDQADKSPESGWAPSYLVDGFTSRYRLIEWPEYLPLLEKRGQLEREKLDLEAKRFSILHTGRNLIIVFSVLIVVSAIVGWIWVTMRQRGLIRREAEQLRQQIARDLHDDIGSNLGGIVLLSEIGSQYSVDEDSRSDFETIRQAAEDASSSMRDIVWLIQREPVGLKDFVTRMRQSLRTILKYHDVSMDVEPSEFRDHSLSLLFRRHVFLAFKEVLNNIRKHAQTTKVSVKVEIKENLFRFIVEDSGVGFDPEATGHVGYGLGNLKRRASRVSGSIVIDSSPNKGTKIIFDAPLI